MSGNSNATRSGRTVKLSQRPDGRWCRKHRGRRWYSPTGCTHAEAVKLFRAEWDDFCKATDAKIDNPQPQQERNALTLFALRDAYLQDYAELVEIREGGGRHNRKGKTRFSYNSARRLLNQFCDLVGDKPVNDLGPDDFTKFARVAVDPMAASTGRKAIGQVLALFNWGLKNQKLDRLPTYGTRFEKPRAEPKRNGELEKLLFTRDELKRLLAVADRRMRAMMLLALNCSFGANDISEMRVNDFTGEWLREPRVKTGVDRVNWLWPETRQAIADYLQHDRPNAADSDRLFLTRWGRQMVRVSDTEKQSATNQVGELFTELMVLCECRKPGRNWHSLRRSLRSVAGGHMDEAAARRVMGHASKDKMDDVYQHVSDERIRAVCEHVRSWLFGK